MDKKFENEKHYGTEITWNPKDYNPILHGAVEAIRIFYSENTLKDILAELKFCFGGTTIIEWTNCSDREMFEEGINGYTLILDERVVIDNYKAVELFSEKNISDYARMRLEESEGILKAKLKRQEYYMNSIKDEYDKSMSIYKKHLENRLLALDHNLDNHLMLLTENASNDAIQIQQRLKGEEEKYDELMKAYLAIHEKLKTANKNEEETNENH